MSTIVLSCTSLIYLLKFIKEREKNNVQDTCLASAWYEVLSVVHLIAMLCLLQANLMLLPKESSDDCERKVSEGLYVLMERIQHK